MTFEELGAALRAEREKRNLAIDDVAKELKISPRQLRALESGDIASLPHPAYARGFIRSYGAWLGLDSAQIQEALDTMHPGVLKKPQQTHETIMPETAPVEKKKSGGLIVFFVFCILAAAAWYAWKEGYLDFLTPHETSSNSGIAEKLPSADAYMATRDAERNQKAEAEMRQTEARTGTEVKTSPQQPESAQTTPPETVATPIMPSGDRQPIESRLAEAPAPAPVVVEKAESQASAVDENKPAQHKLIITAIEECWVHSNADKTDTDRKSVV